MKKLLTTLGFIGLVAVSALGQNSSAPQFRFLPLFSGYNMLVPTNLTYGPGVLPQAGVSVTATNVLYTAYNGQILYAYSNNINGGLSSNGFAADAFKIVRLVPDNNADVNANASVIISIGNTNYLPIVATNSTGQFFIPTVTTNGAFPFLAGPNPTIWPLGNSSGPNWMFPATTNFYPSFATGTNPVVVSLYRAHAARLNGGGDASPGNNTYIFETSSAFSFTVASPVGAVGSTVQTVITNLPIAWLQGANFVAATITATASGASSQGVLVNQLGLLQPQ